MSRIVDKQTSERSFWNIGGRYKTEVVTERGTRGTGRSDYSRQDSVKNAIENANAKEARDKRK